MRKLQSEFKINLNAEFAEKNAEYADGFPLRSLQDLCGLCG